MEGAGREEAEDATRVLPTLLCIDDARISQAFDGLVNQIRADRGWDRGDALHLIREEADCRMAHAKGEGL